MSTVKKNPEELEQPIAPETEAPVSRKGVKASKKAAKKAAKAEKKTAEKSAGNWGWRIFALVLAVIGVALPCVVAIFVMKDAPTEMTLIEMITGLGEAPQKLFGMLPAYTDNMIAGLTTYVFVLLLVVATVIGIVAFFTKKAKKLFRLQTILLALGYIANIVGVIVAGGFDTEKLDLISIGVAVIALGAFILSLGGGEKKKKEVPQPTPAPQAPPAPAYVVEEYAEALPYDGGPVEGVEIAEEVIPTFNPEDVERPVNTAGYDFYNCKSFDPFIAILNTEERNQFTELFILKFKGVMPEIPDYVVGGDNKEFFRKPFIYLGQYRDRIPDGLLAKIYQFAIKF